MSPPSVAAVVESSNQRSVPRRREQTWMGRRRCRPHPSPVRFRVNLGQANCRHIFVYQGLVGDVDSVVALLALLYEV